MKQASFRDVAADASRPSLQFGFQSEPANEQLPAPPLISCPAPVHALVPLKRASTVQIFVPPGTEIRRADARFNCANFLSHVGQEFVLSRRASLAGRGRATRLLRLCDFSGEDVQRAEHVGFENDPLLVRGDHYIRFDAVVAGNVIVFRHVHEPFADDRAVSLGPE
jgi:hypothetical protein